MVSLHRSTTSSIFPHSLSALCNVCPFLLLFVCQEKRRLQEEQDRARRDMEDEKLRLQQLKVWHTCTGCVARSYSHTCSPDITQQKSSADLFWLVSEQIASKSISFSHTHTRTHTHTDAHARWNALNNLPRFLVQAASHKVKGKPSFAEIRFNVSVYIAAALLFSHHSHTGTPTSYTTVLRSPRPHSSNCARFV